MKKIVKRMMWVVAAIAMLLMSTTALAMGEFVQENDLSAALPSWVANSGFEAKAWEHSKCGYTTERNIYVAMSNDAHMIFDAGEGMAYSDAEIKIAATTANNGWVFWEQAHRDRGVIQVSDNGTDWTYVTGSVLEDAVVTNSNFKTTTLKFNAGGKRYIRINSYAAEYYPNYAIGAWSFMIHGASLAGEKAPLIASDLTTDAGIHEVNGFSLVNWAYQRCGYTTARNIYSNAGSTANMIFKADEGKGLESAAFRLTLHRDARWIVSADHLGNRILYSNNGTDWKNATTTAVVADDGSNSADGVPFYTYTLSVDLGEPVRYIKLDMGGANGYQVYVHNAKIYGGDAVIRERLQESDLISLPSWATQSGFDFESWEYTKCGYTAQRNVLVAKTNDAHLIFDAGEGKVYSDAEIKIAANTAGGGWVFWEEVHRNRGLVQVSDNGTDWIDIANTTLDDIIETNSNFKTTTLKFNAGNKRYIRLNSYSTSGAVGAWSFIVHNAKFYGANAFEMVTAPSVAKVENTVTATGAYKNISGTNDYAFLGVYSGNVLKAVGVQSLTATQDARTINVTADVSGVADISGYQLFIWTADQKPLVEAIPLN